MKTDYKNRFWEIDFLRGIAIISMIIFHLFFDLYFFEIYDIGVKNIYWSIFGKAIFILFFLLVGISLTLSYNRAKKENTLSFNKYFNRGIKVLFWGLIITLFSWFFMREGFVVFGVLHFIGVSIIFAYPLLKYRWFNLILSIFVIGIGVILYNSPINFYWFLWLGLVPINFYSVDYFPLLPFFGFILIGIFLGNTFYKNYKRRFKLKNVSKNRIIKSFNYLGRKSLIIYLVHQPIIILLILLFR